MSEGGPRETGALPRGLRELVDREHGRRAEETRRELRSLIGALPWPMRKLAGRAIPR